MVNTRLSPPSPGPTQVSVSAAGKPDVQQGLPLTAAGTVDWQRVVSETTWERQQGKATEEMLDRHNGRDDAERLKFLNGRDDKRVVADTIWDRQQSKATESMMSKLGDGMSSIYKGIVEELDGGGRVLLARYHGRVMLIVPSLPC